MQLDKRKVENGISSKGFRIDNTKHCHSIYYTTEGLRTSIKTHTSHGAKGPVNDFLIAQMARQCKLQKLQFVDLVNCPLSREAYEDILREQKYISLQEPKTDE